MEAFFINYQYTIQFFVALGTVGAVISSIILSLPKKEKGAINISLAHIYDGTDKIKTYLDLTIYNKGQVDLHIDPSCNLNFIDKKLDKGMKNIFMFKPRDRNYPQVISPNSSHSYQSDFPQGFLDFICRDSIQKAYVKTKSSKLISISKKSLRKMKEDLKQDKESK